MKTKLFEREYSQKKKLIKETPIVSKNEHLVSVDMFLNLTPLHPMDMNCKYKLVSIRYFPQQSTLT